ncbi:MAG: hypothetical protein IT269_14900 [Saprospiraceae bacterium]|nr:hypothetical protein [Saprospiraceae bacterium]
MTARFQIFWGVICWLIAPSLSAQKTSDYVKNVNNADVFLAQKRHLDAAKAYTAAFKSLGWQGQMEDRYNAARAYAMVGIKDSAFYNLYRITEKRNFDDLNRLEREEDFKSLYADERWGVLIKKVKANRPAMPALRDTLLAIKLKDQEHRSLLDSINACCGRQSKEARECWTKIRQSDRENLPKITQILDRHGWLGPEDVGEEGSMTFFLVLQHSELPIQEKYLPLLRQAVENGQARGSELALMEDRILLQQGKKQLYGTQIRIQNEGQGKASIYPIENPRQVDERRRSLGLEPMAEYVSIWKLTWNEQDIEEMEKK